MARGCNNAECTVAETGICLLGNPADNCVNRTVVGIANVHDDVATQVEALPPPTPKPRFAASLTLDPDAAGQLMRSRYCRVVGILGAPDAGKTAALVSLYLLLAQERLGAFEYCESRTLAAFDEVSRGARRWTDSTPPEQMTTHTSITNERTAGFLHLRVKPPGTARPVDLLLPDLPGEWTTSLVRESRVDRLEFIKSADALWLMVDGVKFLDASTRNLAVHTTRLLIQKAAELLQRRQIPVTLVLTRLDRGKPLARSLQALADEGLAHGLRMKIVHIASFGSDGTIAAGTGIVDLVEDLCDTSREAAAFWRSAPRAIPTRAMLGYGRGEVGS
ncbi:TRAFAC clade GTPase domain-containing protein [Rhizobacter sp. P5_C2]